MRSTISYGKAHIPFYRTYATPLSGVTTIPESRFSGRENTLFAAEVDVEVFGDNFLAAYTEGDNSNVVATDTMKNFVLKQMLGYDGATLEGSLYYLGSRFLETYPQMHSLRMSGKELPFRAAQVPGEDSGGFAASNVLFSRSREDYAFAALDLERSDDGVRVTAHRCGQLELQLIKVTGSSFASFLRDEHTTLPERKDRPLFIYLDVYWKYGDVGDATGSDLGRYIPAEQVRDLVQTVFHRFVSMSIQHLVYEMGVGLLERFPQMAEVTFEAQNRLWDTAFVSEDDERIKVYTDPRPPYGSIKLTLGREE
ncbi:MAG: urate oxidase [Chloroflexota bacterium]|nr:urate oxidase [Chloroflexota bacterium]MDQ5865118.1 urate oxidase [Chloroflexota bacterium]